MIKYELRNIDPEDLEDLLLKVEVSFNITFAVTELAHITTFGQLCDHIVNKIQLVNSKDCTSRQAFYKLRDAISKTIQIDKETISPDFPLANLLPRQNRRSGKHKLEEHLGFKLNIIRPPHWVTATLIIIFLASFAQLFFNWQAGIVGLVFSIAGNWFADRAGNELDVKTVGQVAEKMTRENYLQSRRDSGTYNKNEIEKILTDLFSDNLGLDKSKLTREAAFV